MRHLPKVHGDPGRLWGDEPTPWVTGSDSFLRWVGRAGPRAQESYSRRHPRAGMGFRIAGVVLAVSAVGAIAIALFR